MINPVDFCIYLVTSKTIERGPIVKAEVSSKAISSIKGFGTIVFWATKWFNFCVDPHVDLKAVRSEKPLTTSVFAAFEAVFP